MMRRVTYIYHSIMFVFVMNVSLPLCVVQVRGVGAGGIVSTAFCILYKLYTLRLTRKQVVGLLNHADSPYIRGLGFMYIRLVVSALPSSLPPS